MICRETLEAIAQLVSGMKYSDWCKIRHAIEQKYSSETAKVTIGSPEELMKMFQIECT